MNWDKEIQQLIKLNHDVRVGTSPKENERAISMYNRALEQIANDNHDVAMIALERLTREFPLFSQATHLYGLCLGRQQNWKAAEDMLQKALLSDLSAEEYQAVETAMLVAREGKIRARESGKAKRKKEKMLSEVKANLARGGILERADHSRKADKMRMATAREREEVLQQIRAQEQGGLPQGLELDTGQSFNRKVQIISLIVIVAAVIFLVFYFWIRPGIIRQRETSKRLDWIVREMEKRATAEPDVSDLLTEYRSRFSQK
ncbi:MAG TPA: hypothetical protein GXX72_05915 [Clostridiaceae bacterium]|nr:hypothetical protein [Clostridiaceae bacterium]